MLPSRRMIRWPPRIFGGHLMKAKYSGDHHDEAAFQDTLRAAVIDVVQKQVDCGIEIVTDGEMSKPGFFTYIRERLDGFESRPSMKFKLFEQEVIALSSFFVAFFYFEQHRFCAAL